MAGNRINIMNLRQLIILKTQGVSNRKAAELLHISRNTVNDYIRIFNANNLSFEQLLELDTTSLESLFPINSEIDAKRYKELSKYFNYFEKELKKPGCTLEILWREYIEKHPDGYKHSQFHHHYLQWLQTVKGSCKLTHKAGEKVFIDFTGKKLSYIDKSTGEIIEVNVFVAILPCSQYTYVKAVPTQSKEDLIIAMKECLEYFEGVPQAIVSDNLKAVVTKAHKYQPIINQTLTDFSLHYKCTIDPTRIYSPQDKALVEGAVKLVYQRIFYPLNKHSFFSLHELNVEILNLLKNYNNQLFSRFNSSRTKEYLSLEKEYLQTLPQNAYTIKYFKRLKVQKMGYIYLSDDKHYYSVPYQYIQKEVEISYDQNNIEIFYNNTRITFHKRDYTQGKYTTNSEHLSSTHRAYSEWSLEFFQSKAVNIGEHTKEYITRLISQYSYPEIGYKQALGITLLPKQYSLERVEKACKRGLLHSKCSYYTIEKILKNKLDDQTLDLTQNISHIQYHENIRGSEAYN